ncbi:hypothetical protein HPHPP28B_0683 [Helicobacter pylori Hp P-28b]|uniref:Uncharacterized protein n=1 Tax=Helicobacter pylori Hp H-34 TaxID=992069 RepID=I9VQT9_HELPX|nr:hypothetical protein HPHPH34_1164 [Helicobacter pylori Hp H-34]EJC39606.1 hypothetical protein HPHPP28B_0683 [Helicobacter pylori Hp P-28b]
MQNIPLCVHDFTIKQSNSNPFFRKIKGGLKVLGVKFLLKMA